MTKHARLPEIDRPPAAQETASRAPRLRTRYYAFLSYSHQDKALADWLHRELERFRVPRSLAGRLTANGVVPRRLTPIFRDQQDLSAGADLGEEIKAALAASQFLVVLCSPTAATSRWTNAEIESFKRTRPEGCVLAAVVAGEPFASDIAGREAEECFPPALRYKYDRRGHQTAKRAEPLAADFRETGEGRRIALLKLIAGMLGVGLDELVQRDTTRRHRQLAWLATGSLAGMAIASALAVTAIQARDAARDQRREAEGLVAFMLGDLKDKLEPIGRLDALDGVGSRVLAYYSQQDASELSDAALMQRARALSLTAQVAYLRGNMGGAQRLYREAMAGTREAVSRSPDDPQRLFDHAQNVFWIGEIARYRGRSADAEAAYREYKRLADRMVALEPDNLRWRMEDLYAQENIGIVLRIQRRFDESARQFAGALTPIQNLASIDPTNSAYQKELSTVLAWSADSQSDLGRLDAAIRLRQRQISLLRGLISRGQTSVEVRRHLIPAHQGLAILLSASGKPEQAIEQLRLAVAEADRLIPIEPDNILWKGLAAQARLELAKRLPALGGTHDSSSETAAGCRLAAEVEARDTAGSWRHLRTDCFAARSRLALRSGSQTQAVKLAEQALASAKSERRPDPVTIRYRIASAYRHLGDVRRELNETDGAYAAWRAALGYLPQNTAERPAEMSERAEILRRLGQESKARLLASRLAEIGFKDDT